MLAAGAHAFLARRRALVIALFDAQKNILKLVHPRIRKKQRRIIRRNERRAPHAPVPLLLEKSQKRLANLVASQFVLRNFPTNSLSQSDSRLATNARSTSHGTKLLALRVYIYGRLGGDHEVLTVVHSLGAVLAAGITRAGALSHRLAAVASVPHCRNRGGWRARACSRDYSIPSAHPTRATHGLIACGKEASMPSSRAKRGIPLGFDQANRWAYSSSSGGDDSARSAMAAASTRAARSASLTASPENPARSSPR